MKHKRYHGMYEQYLFEQEQAKKYTLNQDNLMQKQSQERKDFFDKLNRYRTQRELSLQKKVGLAESVYNDMLGTALKAIYISSLGNISEQAEAIANRNVDNYITENGGARKIIRENRGKTYLLDTIFDFVNEAYESEMNQFNLIEEASKKADKDQKAADDEATADALNNMEAQDNNGQAPQPDEPDAVGEPQPADQPAPVDDTKASKKDGPGVPASKDKDGDHIEDVDSQVQDIAKQEGEPAPADDQAAPEEAPAPEDDNLDEKIAQQPDSKEELFKKMEQEDDVNAAVDLISQRIQDAEADFIKKNAQDKKKIEKIVDKLNTRINGATGNTDPNTTPDNLSAPAVDPNTQDANAQQQEIQAAQQEAARAISDVKERGRFHSVFEEMVKNNASYIVKEQNLLEAYTDGGRLNVDSVVESTRVMYGFLEFVNTVQLESVNTKYIEDLLNDY